MSWIARLGRCEEPCQWKIVELTRGTRTNPICSMPNDLRKTADQGRSSAPQACPAPLSRQNP
ncbi:hypothetical protein CN171_35305 [Sinorhizobium meliloti]|nr:hypothetical protein CN171_35305 [Sinorhizobium meliloti]